MVIVMVIVIVIIIVIVIVRVAEVGSLSARAKMATKFFVRRVFGIFTFASLLCIIANGKFNS